MNESLEKFGAFFVRNLRDKMFQDLEKMIRGEWKADGLQKLQERVVRLSDSIADWRSDFPGRRHCRPDSGSTWTRWPPYSWGARASPIVKSESGKSVTKSKW
jgi:hypothetical protein